MKTTEYAVWVKSARAEIARAYDASTGIADEDNLALNGWESLNNEFYAHYWQCGWDALDMPVMAESWLEDKVQSDWSEAIAHNDTLTTRALLYTKPHRMDTGLVAVTVISECGKTQTRNSE